MSPPERLAVVGPEPTSFHREFEAERHHVRDGEDDRAVAGRDEPPLLPAHARLRRLPLRLALRGGPEDVVDDTEQHRERAGVEERRPPVRRVARNAEPNIGSTYPSPKDPRQGEVRARPGPGKPIPAKILTRSRVLLLEPLGDVLDADDERDPRRRRDDP